LEAETRGIVSIRRLSRSARPGAIEPILQIGCRREGSCGTLPRVAKQVTHAFGSGRDAGVADFPLRRPSARLRPQADRVTRHANDWSARKSTSQVARDRCAQCGAARILDAPVQALWRWRPLCGVGIVEAAPAGR
jgi:hypothetical protein